MPLQDLPPEVLILILGSAGSRSNLRAMASTSQRIYSVFISEKAALIYRALADELGPVLSDALALSKIETFDASSPSYHREVRASVSMYDGYLTGQTRPSPRQLSVHYVHSLVKWYQIMSDLTSVYTTSELKLFQKEAKYFLSSMSLAAPPSRTEHLRVLRAFYRLQIIFNVYGSPESGARRKYNKPDTECINYRLFGLWETWELQQVLCVATFVTRLHRRFTTLEDRDLRAEGISRRVLYGLGVLRDFIAKVRRDYEVAWETILRETSSLTSGLRLMGSFEQYDMVWFHYRYYDYRMSKFPPGRDNCLSSLRFHGEHTTTVPFAWADAFDGQYPHDFDGRYTRTEGEVLRLQSPNKPIDLVWCCFGFAMWDAPRIATLKTSSVHTEFRTGWALSS